MKYTTIAFILALSANSAFAQSSQNSLSRAALTCDLDIGNRSGEIHLDLRNQTAYINVYCHAAGCSGEGRIINHTSQVFLDTFLLEMSMDQAPQFEYMIVKVRPNGSGEIFNYSKDARLFNCIMN